MAARTPAAACLVLAAAMTAAAQTAPPPSRRPVVIQGAMRLETEKLIARLESAAPDDFGGWQFWRGTLEGYPVVVSRTRMGMTHAAAATALAAHRYQPLSIVNQGTAGGHHAGLRNFDVVLGKAAVNIGAFKSALRKAGSGSRVLDWKPLDPRGSEKSGGEELEEGSIARFPGDEALLAAARGAARGYAKGRVLDGVIGSSDVWNEELDRIAALRARFGTDVEEMETASAAQVAAAAKVPFLGIRVVTANLTNANAYDPTTAQACQDFVYEVVKGYVRGLTR